MRISLETVKNRLVSYWNSPNSRAVIIITFFTFLSRGLGMLRQALIYQRMDKVSSDLLLAANKIPENIAQLLIMGTIITSALPVATRLESKFNDDTKVSKYLSIFLLTIVVILLGINTLLLIFTPAILQLRFVTSPALLDTFREMGLLDDYFATTRILLIGPFLFALQAVLNVFLFLKKRFVVYAWAGMIYNLGAIVGILATPNNGYYTTAWGMLIGALATVFVYLWDAKKGGFRGFSVLFEKGKGLFSSLKSSFVEYQEFLKQTWKVFIPRILILDSIITANLLITPFAQNAGQVTAVDIALSIQGAFFIIISSLATVVFPDLAKLIHSSHDKFWSSLRYYTRNTVLLSLGVTLITFIGAPLIMWLISLLGRGQGNGQYIIFIANIAALGIVFRALKEMLGKYFFVRERLWQPAVLSVSASLVQIGATYMLVTQGVDSGVSVAITLTLHNLAWFMLAGFIIYQDWKKDGFNDEKPRVGELVR